MSAVDVKNPNRQKFGSSNSMFGRTHSNKDKFRKYPGHPAINYDNFTVDTSGIKKFMMKCLTCSASKGYRRLDSIDLPCFSCAMKKNQKYSPIQKRIRESAKSRMNSRLRRKKLGKATGIHFKDFPWNLNELMIHLESKFKTGMSWNNYGEWEIDHIRPDSSFTYSAATDKEFLECWSLNNLQPLWAIENRKKGAKYENI